jgi:hypothetical protein
MNSSQKSYVHIRGWCRAAAAFVLIFSGAVAARAQAPQVHPPDHRGGVSGTVTRTGGGDVSGLTVKFVNADNGAEFTGTTNAQGGYAFPALPVGNYSMSVESAGLTVYRQSGIAVAADQTVPLNITLDAGGGQLSDAERQELMERIATLEQRITDLESTAVLSEPETRVRRVEVNVDEAGNVVDQAGPNTQQTVTYERERVYRRQTINEKLEAALEDAANRRVTVGVDAAVAMQAAGQTRSHGDLPNSNAYALASADLFFTAGIAQYTVFFADIVGLSGAPPDAEIPTLSLLNGYTARLVRQNELNLREAWLRTELFGQRLALTAGRLDLTNYFDQNALANDESTQFLSDALVNNQMLGLATNGTGVAAEFDPKIGLRFKFGFQQSNTDATNLSDSLYTLSEVGATVTPFALPEGNYRVWFRTDNTAEDAIRTGVGFSLDQKLTNVVGLFARYGTQELDFGRDHFYSAGVGFQNGLIISPQDMWGVGYAQMDLESGEAERLAEGYYNFHITDRLRLSFHLTWVLDRPDEESDFAYVLPGIRFQAAF